MAATQQQSIYVWELRRQVVGAIMTCSTVLGIVCCIFNFIISQMFEIGEIHYE